MKRTTIYLEDIKINKLQEYSYKNKINTVFTFDRKYFNIYKPKNFKTLNIVPL